jgi:HKD family nuclease
VEAFCKHPARISVVTRPPETDWHEEALTILRKNVRPIVYFSTNLHAKLYILECDGFRYAVLGSPNLTMKGNAENRELAVEFRTSTQSAENSIAFAVTNLTAYARSLVAEDDVRLAD